MLKFNKVLLASDFDNTLVYTQGALERGEDIPPMSARNREAVEYFIQNGGYFSISTGRALPAFARYAKDLPCNAPCVIANGAAIYDFNKNCYVETAFLDADIYDHVDALLARFKTPAAVIGRIAGLTGLAPTCDPATPEELLGTFDLAALPTAFPDLVQVRWE